MRSCTGEEASEVSADQTCSFAVGSMVTPSLARIAATHSAAQARSALIVDARQRLQRHRMLGAGRQAAAEIVPVAAHGERRGADRAAEVEGEDLVVAVAAELHRHQRQQHRLAGAGRADDQRVADIADMQAEAGTASSLRSCRRAAAAPGNARPVPGRPRPPRAGSCARDSASRPAAGGRWRRHGRACEPSQASSAFTPSGMQVKSRPWMTFSTSRSFSAAMRRVLVPDRDGRGDIGLADIVGAQFLQGHVGIGRLVGGVGVDEGRRLVGHHLLDDGGDRLALGEPLPPDLGQQLHRFGLVEQDRAGRPAIGEGEPVQLVEDAGMWSRSGIRRR